MIRIIPTTFSGTLQAPPSKAHTHRLMFAAAYADTPTTISNPANCTDVHTTIRCLRDLGCTFYREENQAITVEPFSKTKPLPHVHFDFSNCATTSRYALALASAYGIWTDCQASDSLIRRPFFPLAGPMALRGVTFSAFSFPLTTQGRLEGGRFELNGMDSYQFIDSLLLATPVLSQTSSILISQPLLQQGQVDMTLDVLRRFGIAYEVIENGYQIPGRQIHTSPGHLQVTGDWSLAALCVTAGALCGLSGPGVTCTGLIKDSPRGYEQVKGMLPLLASDFTELNLDVSDYPDLAPLIVIAAAAKSATLHLKGATQLRFKETDRLDTLCSILNRMGASMEATEDGIEARGGLPLDYPEDHLVDCQGDPNLAMSFALAAGLLKKPFRMDEKAVDKTWIGFWDHYKALGGKVEALDDQASRPATEA